MSNFSSHRRTPHIPHVQRTIRLHLERDSSSTGFLATTAFCTQLYLRCPSQLTQADIDAGSVVVKFYVKAASPLGEEVYAYKRQEETSIGRRPGITLGE